MISVIIPTLNAEDGLARSLAALVPAAVDGVVREVIVVDGGSSDQTLAIADEAGVKIVTARKGRGQQLRAGAENAGQPWLLFLHADTVIQPGWQQEVATFVERCQSPGGRLKAAAFRFALDDSGFMPRLLEAGVALRCSVFSMPYGDQGLLMPRAIYDEIGGFKEIQLLEDVDIIRRLGRRRLAMLQTRAVTSAVRFRKDGYVQRVLRNWMCLGLFYLGVPVERIAKFYDPKS